MILVAIYHMLLTGEVFNPTDLHSVKIPLEQQIKAAKHNLANSLKVLTNNGYSIDDIIKLAT